MAAVKASLDAGAAIGGNHTVDSCVIPRVHPQVIKAINLAAEPGTPGAIGVMEFFSVTASVYAADAAVHHRKTEKLILNHLTRSKQYAKI